MLKNLHKEAKPDVVNLEKILERMSNDKLDHLRYDIEINDRKLKNKIDEITESLRLKYTNIIDHHCWIGNYSIVKNLDAYAGLMGGYNYYLEKYPDFSYSEGQPTFAVFAGAGYSFFKSIAVFAEAGWGYAIVNAGISYRF